MSGLLARLRKGDEVAHLIALLFGLTLVLLTVLIAFQLFSNSALARHRFGWNFFVTSTWDPVADQYGAAPFIYGTLVTSLIALIVAVPLGVGAALFLAELAPPRISDVLTMLTELLAAVPSVVYGLIGVAVLVPAMRQYVQPALQRTLGWLPLFAGPAYGIGYLTAGLVLAIMIVPFIVSVLREVLLAVPRDQREAALALGETMAVTMVIGNRPQIAASLFAPGYSMAAVVANEFTEAVGDLYLQALVEIGLVLFLLTMIINALARILIVVTTRQGTIA